MKTEIINIADEFKEDYISRVAGEKLRKMILDAQSKGVHLEIDFASLTVASTSFFDEGFAKLIDAHSPPVISTREQLDKTVTLKNLKPHDKKLLELILKNRKWK